MAVTDKLKRWGDRNKSFLVGPVTLVGPITDARRKGFASATRIDGAVDVYEITDGIGATEGAYTITIRPYSERGLTAKHRAVGRVALVRQVNGVGNPGAPSTVVGIRSPRDSRSTVTLGPAFILNQDRVFVVIERQDTSTLRYILEVDRIPTLWGLAGSNPSLDLRFAENKSLTDAVSGQNLISFTRQTSGTYVDSQGVIRNAVTNLLLRSEEFGTTWSVSGNNASVIANQDIAPNGTNTAGKLVEDTSASTFHRIQQSASLANGPVSYSVYLKAAGRNFAILTVFNATDGSYSNVKFNLQAGTVDTVITGSGIGSITSVGNGWFRCSVRGTTTVSASNIAYIWTSNATGAGSTHTGDGTSGIYIWGAQLEQSSTVGEYIPTTSTINSAPRFDHNPTTGESLGLLVEEQRTNLLVRSEEFDNASWVKTLATVTSDAGIAPNGSTVADKLVGNSTVDAHYIQQNIAGATSGTPYTSSVYAKAAEISRIEILHVIGATLYAQGYDLSNGTLITRVAGGATAATGGFIQPVGNGWYRCGITQTSDGTSGAMRVTLRSGSTVGFDATSQGVLLWGAQLEAGAFPTSYIPTTGTAATRSADVASISGSNFSSWYRQDEGTVFLSASVPQPSNGNRRVAFATDGTFNNRVGILFNSSNNPQFLLSAAGVTTAAISSSLTATGFVQSAAGYAVDNFAFAAGGVLAGTDTSGAVPSTVDQLSIGSSDGADRIHGHIRRIAFWPSRLSDSTLQAITQ
jgi:hypothetical protein